MELKNVKIKSIGKLKEFDSGFSCVDFVVETQEAEYNQVLKFQINKDKAENFLKYQKVGDVVDLDFNLRGREWTNPQGEVKVFNTLEAWKVFKAEDTPTPAPQSEFETIPDAEVKDISDDDSGLPF